MPEPYKQARRGDADPGLGVKMIRTIPARAGARDHDQVEFQLTIPVPLPVSNEPIVLQVGSLEVGGGGYAYGDPNTLLFRMSAEQFSRAEDGKRIKVKLGYCSSRGVRFGKLNKAQQLWVTSRSRSHSHKKSKEPLDRSLAPFGLSEIISQAACILK